MGCYMNWKYKLFWVLLGEFLAFVLAIVIAAKLAKKERETTLSLKEADSLPSKPETVPEYIAREFPNAF